MRLEDLIIHNLTVIMVIVSVFFFLAGVIFYHEGNKLEVVVEKHAELHIKALQTRESMRQALRLLEEEY